MISQFLPVDGDLAGSHPLLIAEELFLSRVLLYPERYDFDSDPKLMLGHIRSLLLTVLKTSGFNDQFFEATYNKYKQKVQEGSEYGIILTICKVFPILTPDEIRSWDHEKIIEHFVIAEAALLAATQAKPSAQQPPPNTKTQARRTNTQPAPQPQVIPQATSPIPGITPGFVDTSKENSELRQFIPPKPKV